MAFSVRPFRRLQWQLGLSYTLVAVGTLLVVELLLIGAMLVMMNSAFVPNLLAASFREQFGAMLRPYLDRAEPDVAGLGRYLSTYAAPREEPEPDTQIWSVQEAEQNMVVISTTGEVLWSQYIRPGFEVGQALEVAQLPGLERVLPAALANERAPERLYTRTGAQLVMAIPIESEAAAGQPAAGQPARVLGVLVFQLEMPSLTSPAFLSQLMPTLLVSLAVFTLFAGLVGSVFGLFTARGLTRRLGQVSQAADAWSQGDFSTFIPDQAGDELAALARRLNATAEQLQSLVHTRQELAALEERNRMARELHDSVKQQVFAASMQLGAARALLPDDGSPAAHHLEEAERLTHQAQGELNAMIHQLRPAALEGKGLAAALRELAADWSRQSGVAAAFESRSAPGAPPLALTKEEALYRITQEALANVARHSRARSVTLCYTLEVNGARLAIEDDGQGFTPGDGSGMGLKGMRERVAGLNGQIQIESAPGQGARLVITIP